MPIFHENNAGGETPSQRSTYVRDQYLLGINALSELRESTVKNYEHVRGDMISPSMRDKLKKKGLPAIELNIILHKVVRAWAAEKRTRAGIRAVPLGAGKNDTAKALTKIFEKVRVDSNGFQQITDAWLDAIIADLPGWLEVIWTNDNDPLGQPVYRTINPLYVIWDPASRMYDLKDARWVMKTWWATKEDILRDFPEKTSEINSVLSDSFPRRIKGMLSTAWERTSGRQDSLDSQFERSKENLYRLIECQLRDHVTETRLFDPITQSVERPDDQEELEAMKAQFPRLIEVDFKWDRIRIATTVAGDALSLQDEDADVQNGMFSLIPIWNFTFGDKPFGMVKNLLGPQEIFWKETNSALHITNTLANPIWMVPKGSVDERGLKELQQFGATSGFVLEYNMTGGEKPHRDIVNTQVLGKLNLADRAFRLSDQISGIGPNATGQAEGAGESGEVVKTRVAESLAMLEGLLDNKMRSIILLHYYLIALVQEKIRAMRVLRWISDDGSPQMLVVNHITANAIINELKQGEYGVAIEKGEAQFFRQEKFIKLLALARVMGLTAELLEMLVDTFDEITDQEKKTLVNSIRQGTLEQQLAELESDIRDKADQRANTAIKRTQAETKRLGEQNKARQLQVRNVATQK